MKIFYFCLVFLVASLTLSAAPVYVSFVEPGGTTINKSDVQLKLEEQEIVISELTFVDTTKRSPQILAHPAGRRLYVFVYDFLFSTPESLLQARKTTETFLSKIPAEDLILVAGITAQDGLKIFCTPTADRNKVIAGLNWIGQKKVEGMVEGPEGNLYSETFSDSAKPITLLPDASFLQNIKMYAVAEKDKKEMRPVFLQTLADVGFLLSALNGRKHVILFTPGADSSGLSINLPLREKPSKRRKADQPMAEIEHQDIDSITDTSLTTERLEKKASAGPRQKLQKQSGEALPELVAGTDTHVHIFHSGTQEYGLMKNLASKTGGTFVVPGTDVNSTVDQIVASDKTFYVIQGEANTEKMKDLNAVRLTVANKEVQASTRWLIPKNPSNYSSAEKKAKIAENIYKNFVSPPQSYRFWADFMLDQGSSRIPAFVQIDGPSLLQAKTELLDLEFYAFATDANGAVLDYAYFVFSLDLKNKALQEKLKTSGIKIWNVLLGTLQPATIHWTIVNLQTSEMVDQSVPIQGIQAEMTMTQPFFPAMNLNWVVWPSPTTQPLSKRGVEVAYPYKEGKDMIFFPDFSPVLKKATEGQVFFLRVYNMATPGKIPNVRVALVDSSGKTNEVKTLGLLQNPSPVPNGMGLFWRLATLPEIAPGNYQLKVSTVDPLKNQEIVREVPAHIQ